MTSVQQLLERFEATWAAADLASELAETCASDLHYEDPLTFKGPLHGPAALAEHAARLRRAAPDARLEPTGPRVTDGRFVAAPVRLIGTHTGEVDTFPATGRAVTVQAILYCELDESRTRLWRVRAFFDLYDVATQLGVLPKPGSFGQKALLMMRGFGLRPTS